MCIPELESARISTNVLHWLIMSDVRDLRALMELMVSRLWHLKSVSVWSFGRQPWAKTKCFSTASRCTEYENGLTLRVQLTKMV